MVEANNDRMYEASRADLKDNDAHRKGNLGKPSYNVQTYFLLFAKIVKLDLLFLCNSYFIFLTVFWLTNRMLIVFKF